MRISIAYCTQHELTRYNHERYLLQIRMHIRSDKIIIYRGCTIYNVSTMVFNSLQCSKKSY